MADKPSRGLVFYGDGLMRCVSPAHSHLHSLARRASCGFLSLRSPLQSESEDERVIRDLAQLLDAYDSHVNWNREDVPDAESQETSVVPAISEKFMGMKAAIVTKNLSVESFGRKLGFSGFQFDELIKTNQSLSESPPDGLVSELLKWLGFQEGKLLEKNKFDLVFVHIEAGENASDVKDRTIGNNVEWVDNLVGAVLKLVQAGSEIGSRLHFSLIMGYGAVSEDDDPSLSSLISEEEHSNLSLLLPQQSYTMKGGNLIDNIRYCFPMLIAQWQEAVTRTDMTETFSFKDFKEHGGNLSIPADRFLHEVAFKLWMAPKYGA